MNQPSTDLKKKCTICSKWYPATPKYFYRAVSKEGRRQTVDGRPYLKGKCKICYRAESRRNSAARSKKETPEETKRRKELKSARDAAYRSLVLKYEIDFKLFYKKELDKRGIKLKSYKGVQLKEGDVLYSDPKESE